MLVPYLGNVCSFFALSLRLQLLDGLDATVLANDETELLALFALENAGTESLSIELVRGIVFREVCYQPRFIPDLLLPLAVEQSTRKNKSRGEVAEPAKLTAVHEVHDLRIRHASTLGSAHSSFLLQAPVVDVLRVLGIDMHKGVKHAVFPFSAGKARKPSAQKHKEINSEIGRAHV